MTTGIVIGGQTSYYDMTFICASNGLPCSTNSMGYLSRECDQNAQVGTHSIFLMLKFKY